MNLDQSSFSSYRFGFETKLQAGETTRQMAAVFERFFKYFTILSVSGVALESDQNRVTIEVAVMEGLRRFVAWYRGPEGPGGNGS